jgi:hypothetical protein
MYGTNAIQSAMSDPTNIHYRHQKNSKTNDAQNRQNNSVHNAPNAES